MRLLDELPEAVHVGIDSAPVIYLIEEHPTYRGLVEALFYERFDKGLNTAITSVITLSEVLVRPFQEERADLVDRYRDRLRANSSLLLVDLGAAVAEAAARLRARHRIRLPDAFQIAAAIDHGASHFITNDTRLRAVDEVRVLVLNDYLED